MKTRIKIIEKNDGSKVYVCQEKGVHKSTWRDPWAYFPVFLPIILMCYVCWSSKTSSLFCDFEDEYSTLEEAKKAIDDYLEYLDSNYNKKMAQKTKSITYLKYP